MAAALESLPIVDVARFELAAILKRAALEQWAQHGGRAAVRHVHPIDANLCTVRRTGGILAGP
jgi:hypothetical protein